MGQFIFFAFLGLLVLIVLLNFKRIPGIVAALKKFYGEVAFEMTKVAWPSQQQVVNSTVVVLVTTMVLTFGVWVIDSLLTVALRVAFTSN